MQGTVTERTELMDDDGLALAIAEGDGEMVLEVNDPVFCTILMKIWTELKEFNDV